MVILEGAGTQPDDHDNVSNLYADLTQDQRLTHRSRLAARWFRDHSFRALLR
jgi:hypothetical protein